jgi:hypothetical protein
MAVYCAGFISNDIGLYCPDVVGRHVAPFVDAASSRVIQSGWKPLLRNRRGLSSPIAPRQAFPLARVLSTIDNLLVKNIVYSLGRFEELPHRTIVGRGGE